MLFSVLEAPRGVAGSGFCMMEPRGSHCYLEQGVTEENRCLQKKQSVSHQSSVVGQRFYVGSG